MRRKFNPTQPTGTATEMVTRYFRKPKHARGRAWLEEHLGQQKLFQYNPSKVSVVAIGNGKFGVFVMNQLMKSFDSRSAANTYLQSLRKREMKKNPNLIELEAGEAEQLGLQITETGEENTYYVDEEGQRYFCKNYPSQEFHNFDNDQHDVIFADNNDDVIFADDRLIENGMFGDAIKRRVNRFRQGRAFKQELKYADRADRAAARRAALAKQNPHRYFSECKNFDEVKQVYKKLARQFHPDLGGDIRQMQDLNDSYEKATFMSFDGSETAQNEQEANSILREAIEFAVTLEGVDAVIRGLWLWLEGNTYQVKDQIKAFESSTGITFKWANKKKAWFFAAVPSSNRRGEMSFSDIEKLYGRESVQTRGRNKLNPSLDIFENAYILAHSGYSVNDIAHYLGVSEAALADEISVSNDQFINNPAWLANATNALVGIASAAQIREHLQNQSRRKNTRKVTTKRKAKKNPHGDIFEEFTGREATTTTEMPVSHLAPQKLDKLGDLVEIRLVGGQKLEFNPNARNHKVWLTAANKRQMWIVGTTVTKPNPHLKDSQVEEIGVIDKIVYHEFKPVVGDEKPEYYIHQLGEWSGEKPILAADKDGFPVIYGGNYSIESRGIVD